MLEESTAAQGIDGFSTAFLIDEWDQVVDAWQIDSWETYRDVKRLARKTRLSESRREQLWKVFASLQAHSLSKGLEVARGSIALSTMHLAKGLEFRAVAVMACDDEVIPNLERIEEIGDEADLEEIYNTERHLLYVACTRARDRLFVSGTEPSSEFLEDVQ